MDFNLLDSVLVNFKGICWLIISVTHFKAMRSVSRLTFLQSQNKLLCSKKLCPCFLCLLLPINPFY